MGRAEKGKGDIYKVKINLAIFVCGNGERCPRATCNLWYTLNTANLNHETPEYQHKFPELKFIRNSSSQINSQHAFTQLDGDVHTSRKHDLRDGPGSDTVDAVITIKSHDQWVKWSAKASPLSPHFKIYGWQKSTD